MAGWRGAVAEKFYQNIIQVVDGIEISHYYILKLIRNINNTDGGNKNYYNNTR